MKSISASTNYECHHHSGVNCSDGQRAFKSRNETVNFIRIVVNLVFIANQRTILLNQQMELLNFHTFLQKQ